MRKNWLFMLLTLVMIVVLVACSDDSEEVVDEVITADSNVAGEVEENSSLEEVKARLAHNYPVEHHTSQGYELFSELVKEKSDGKINITIYPSGQLYNDLSVPDAVSTGQIEMGVNALEMWTTLVPAAEAIVLPLFDDYSHVHAAIDGGLNDIFTSELNKVGARPLMWTDFGFAYYASKGEPLSTPENFKGKRIRTVSPLMSKYVELAGGSPVTISGSEVVQALQRGTIDGALSGLVGFTSVQYYEYTKNYSGPLNAGINLVTANEDWWQGLSTDAQKIITEAAAEAELWISEEGSKVFGEAEKQLADEGMVFVPMDKEAFADIEEALIEEYIDRTGEIGNQIVDTIRNSK